jgi:hypothetical protein
MDFDVDDDDARLCGYDRAYVCFDRFSWFAVPPTPFTCNGTFAAASFPFTGSPSHRLSAALNFPSQCSVSMFSLDSRSRRHHSGKLSFSPAVLAAAFKTLRGAPRLPTRRTHETSRSEHDLNLAILYAVQSGVRYSASLLCLTCVADLLEPTIMLRAFKATRHPHPRAIP